jgi:hypothetical protein
VSKKPNESRPNPEPPVMPSPIVQPMIDELKGKHVPKEDLKAPPRGPLHPPEPAEPDQEPAGDETGADPTDPQT